jgi:hypothetical protein
MLNPFSESLRSYSLETFDTRVIKRIFFLLRVTVVNLETRINEMNKADNELHLLFLLQQEFHWDRES